MTTNEAADRLPGDSYCDLHSRCGGFDPFRHPGQFTWTVEDDRATERRATVERIQSNVRLVLLRHHVNDADVATCDVCAALYRAVLSTDAILDEEAAR